MYSTQVKSWWRSSRIPGKTSYIMTRSTCCQSCATRPTWQSKSRSLWRCSCRNQCKMKPSHSTSCKGQSSSMHWSSLSKNSMDFLQQTQYSKRKTMGMMKVMISLTSSSKSKMTREAKQAIPCSISWESAPFPKEILAGQKPIKLSKMLIECLKCSILIWKCLAT